MYKIHTILLEYKLLYDIMNVDPNNMYLKINKLVALLAARCRRSL